MATSPASVAQPDPRYNHQRCAPRVCLAATDPHLAVTALDGPGVANVGNVHRDATPTLLTLGLPARGTACYGL